MLSDRSDQKMKVFSDRLGEAKQCHRQFCLLFRDFVNNIIQDNYATGVDQSLDKSQIKCGHRHSRFGCRGKSHKPLSDYINFIAANDSTSGYAYTFKIVLRIKGQKVADHVMDILDDYLSSGLTGFIRPLIPWLEHAKNVEHFSVEQSSLMQDPTEVKLQLKNQNSRMVSTCGSVQTFPYN